VIPDAVTPLTWSIVKDATNNGFKHTLSKLGFPHEEADFFKVFDGRVYFNQTTYQGFMNILPQKRHNPLFLLKAGVNCLLSLFSLKRNVSHVEHKFRKSLIALSLEPKPYSINELKKYLEACMAVHIRITLLMDLLVFAIRKVTKKYIPQKKANQVIDGLVTGLDGIESTVSQKALWELAYMVKDNAELTTKILTSHNKSVPDVLRSAGPVYEEKWQNFLESFGHSSLREFEIYYPRWAEDPSFVISVLKSYLLEAGDNDPNIGQRIRADKRVESEKILLKSIPRLYKVPVKFLIHHVQQCSILRESMKQKLVKATAEIRKQALAFAHEKNIMPLDDIFFLTLEQINSIKDGHIPPDFLDKVASRKQDWEQWQKQEPYQEIRVYIDGRQMKLPYLTDTGVCLCGLALSSGTYTGKAKVITDPSRMGSFATGDILVAHSTNPSWTPLFTLAGAIVTDMGNYLSHGAIVARELGIPAVGNVFTATKEIETGEMIYVDGGKGIVRKV
jgi:pyruvate,water dikinase